MRTLLVIVAISATSVHGLFGNEDEPSDDVLKEPAFSAEDIEFFETSVRPLLAKRCYECHSGKAKSLKAGLRLDSRATILKGGDSGPAAIPKNADESLLIDAIRWQSFEMPPSGKLPAEEVEILTQWVSRGAPWPETGPGKGPGNGGPGNGAAAKGYDWEKWKSSHWAFQPVRSPSPPKVVNAQWTQNEVDSFLLGRLEEAGLTPAPRARPEVLVRRIYLDLLGLPPTAEQVASFRDNADADYRQAVADLVDQLLESPHYGERWGRHWLDVARYSDDLPSAWRYRDWIIGSFNSDLPFDAFVRLQIAGDLDGTPEATGFFALGPTYGSDGGDPESVAQARGETLSDRLDTLGRGMLGLTLACARCHDHKFDPIPQQDYYSLAGIFNNSAIGEVPLAPAEIVSIYNDRQKAIAELNKRLTDRKKSIANEKREPIPEEAAEIAAMAAELAHLRRTAPPKYAFTHGLHESGSGNMKVAIRGDLRKEGEVAPRRFLKIVSDPEYPNYESGSGRLELAADMSRNDNPLVGRVFVNRIWMHHFGKAIVRSPSNFGFLGAKPTHPMLLDWLTAFFLENGGSTKALHRLLMNSAAYQMSGRYDADSYAADGDNRLLWRANPRKMDVESWRDTLLAVTGELDRSLGGPPIEDVKSHRRTVYLKVSRNGDQFGSDEFLRLFDFPLMRASVAQRPTSIVPQQYLFMLNSSFMIDRSKKLASLAQDAVSDPASRVDWLYRRVYGRAPTDLETAIGVEYLTVAESTVELDSGQGEKPNGSLLLHDFDGADYDDWVAVGTAFGNGPAKGTLAGQMEVTGFLGTGLVNSFLGGDGATGTLTSPEFKIDRKQIHMLVGGGKYPGATCIDLIVNGQVVRTATGPNDRGGGSERLSWSTWDVQPWVGQTAVFRIVDSRTEGWGHINVDHIYQSNDAHHLDHMPQPTGKPKLADRLQQYAQVLLSSNEFLFVR